MREKRSEDNGLQHTTSPVKYTGIYYLIPEIQPNTAKLIGWTMPDVRQSWTAIFLHLLKEKYLNVQSC